MSALTSYYAKVGISTDLAQLKKVDRYLSLIEKKMQDFQKRMKSVNGAFNINFKFNTGRLQFEAQKAFVEVGKKTKFPVTNFLVDKNALSAQISASIKQAIAGAGRVINLKANVQGGRFSAGLPVGHRGAASLQRTNFLHAGGAIGALSRYGLGSLPFVGGALGAGQLNQASQELQANELALKAVSGAKAAGYQEYLNNLGNRLGMTTRDLQPGFTQYLASAQGTALEAGIKQDFSSFTQYGAVMGLNPEEMKGSLRAITQMVSKQQIYAEELKGQLAERMPAAVRLMAEAVTGGDTKALIKMMEAGELDPNMALPKFFEEMRKRSDPMLPEYFKTARFAQGKMNKALEDQLKIFSKAGGDEGFARFFRLMGEAAAGAEPLVRGLAGAFSDLSIAFQAPINLFGLFNDGLEKISVNTGLSKTAFIELAAAGGMLMTKWGRVAVMFTTIALVLEDIAFGLQGKESYTKDFLEWVNKNSAPIEQRRQDPNDPLGRKGPLANIWQRNVLGTEPGTPTAVAVDPQMQMMVESRMRAKALNDPSSLYYQDPAGYDTQMRERAIAQQQEGAAKSTQNAFSFGDINVSIPMETAAMVDEDRAKMFANMLQIKLQEALSDFGTNQ